MLDKLSEKPGKCPGEGRSRADVGLIAEILAFGSTVGDSIQSRPP